MEEEYISLGNEIKNDVINCLDKVFDSIDKSSKKEFFSPFYEIIKGMKTSYIESCDHDSVIEQIVNETHNYWDYIKERDEERIINISNDKLKEYNHSMIQQMGEKWFNYILQNRRDFFTEEFEKKLWLIGDNIIRKTIKYIHLRRIPLRNEDGSLRYKEGTSNPIYTRYYASKISVKKNANTWNIDIV